MPPRKATPPENLMTSADFNGADPAAFDHDGDGRPGGSLPREVPNVVTTRPPEPPKMGEVVKRGDPPPEVPQNLGANAPVRVRITKAGHGQIHDGEGGTYNWQDEVVLPFSVAKAQERNQFAEIIGR